MTDKFTVAIGQISPTLGNIEANIEMHLAEIERARGSGADLVVFPELGITGYFLRDMVATVSMADGDELLQPLLDASRNISIVLGYVETDDDMGCYNCVAYLEDGRIVHKHRKVYLPTYGMFDERRYFARGDRFRAFDTRFGRFGMLTCEDAWHISSPYILSRDRAQVLFVMSSSPGRGVSGETTLDSTRFWQRLNSMTASLCSCFVIYANRVGYEDGVNFWGGSEVVGPEGEPIVRAKRFDPDMIVAEIERSALRRARTYTPLWRDENVLLVLRELERIDMERYDNE